MTQRSLDKTGMWVTTLCALHCLLLPVILPILSLIGLSFLGEELLERLILGTSIVLGLVALVSGMRQHARMYPLVLLVAGGFVYWHKDSLGDMGEPLIILIGAGLIIAAHWVNLRLVRSINPLAPTS
ncbi:MerC domain-containing protein [Pseudidiomarina gelatinasegens]